jgi:arylsulfatase A-like enzyme
MGGRVGWFSGLVVAALVASATGIAPSAALEQEGAGATRPSFVLILADDLDATVTPLWEVMPKSAALLRDRGISFTNAFVPSPDCCPARASLLLGAYPHNTGVYTNNGPTGGWQAFDRNDDAEKTLAVALQSNGYRTALFGKYLNQYRSSSAGLAPPPGWDVWRAFIDDTFYGGYTYTLNEDGTKVAYGTDEADYSTDVIAEKTTQFLDAAAQVPDQPFFAYVAPTAPHYPLPPPPRYATNPWSDAAVPTSPSFYEADLSDKPTWLQWSAAYRDRWKPNVDTDYRNRLGSLMALDDLVASVVARLEANGQLDSTYIVLTSDNGYQLGAHHLNWKSAPYEESIRIPLVIAGPGVASRVAPQMVLLSDLAPTILELAGASSIVPTDMRSLVPLLGSTAPASWRRDFLVERHISVAPGSDPANYYVLGALFDLPSFAAVRTARYKLVEWYQQGELGGTHEYELYDLWTDRYELTNLIKTPQGFQQHLPVVAALLQRLRTLQQCAGATCL